MAEEIIQARVWTKVDTLENWNNNPLLLGPGEIALVTTPSGIPMNMKWGDKTTRKRFSDLPFAIAYDQGQFVAVGGPGALPTPVNEVAYSLVGPGTYTFGATTITAPTGRLSQIVWDGSTWSLIDMGAMPTPDVSGLVAKSDLKSNSLIKPSSTYIKQNTIIASNGNVGMNTTTYLGAVSIVDFPLKPNTSYVLDGFLQSTDKNFALVDSTGAIGPLGKLDSLPKVITTDATHIYLRAYLKLPNASEPADNWSSGLSLIESATPQPRSISQIGTDYLEAKVLAPDNSTPNPTVEKNAVNLGYFNLNGLKKADLELQRSLNLADPSKIISGKYIDSSGNIQTAANWKMIAIDVSGVADGANITFGRFSIQDAGYSAFHNASGLVLNNGSFMNSLLPRTVTKPSGATILYIDISRPTGTNEYSQITVNVGNALMDYEPYAIVKSIAGYSLFASGGGTGSNPFNQNLNKEDTVQFAKVQAGQIDTSVLVLNLPTSPSGLVSGRAWIDTANGNVIKVVS